jgi:hypothetical protein
MDEQASEPQNASNDSLRRSSRGRRPTERARNPFNGNARAGVAAEGAGRHTDEHEAGKRAEREGDLPEVKWYALISQIISDIYSKFNFGQGFERLIDIAMEEEIVLYALKRFCDTAFAQSEHKMYPNFVKNYQMLLRAIRDKVATPRLKQEERRRMQGWIDDCLLDYMFMGEVTCLVPLLDKSMHISLKMRTVNIIPCEVLDLEKKFLQELREMRDALRAEKGFSAEHFPTLHKPIHGRQPGESTTYADFLETMTLLGEQLRIHCDTFSSNVPSNTQEQAYKDLQHLIAEWIDNLMHFFEVHFIDDEHEMILVASKCIDNPTRRPFTRQLPSQSCAAPIQKGIGVGAECMHQC